MKTEELFLNTENTILSKQWKGRLYVFMGVRK